MATKYERLPTSPNRAPDPTSDSESEPDNEQPAPTQVVDARFVRPRVAPWKRVALIAFVFLLFWLAFSMRRTVQKAKQQQQQVLHARRCPNLLATYSKVAYSSLINPQVLE